MADYPTSEEIRTQLQSLRDQVPNQTICQIVTLEPTHGGKPWTFLRVRKGGPPPRPRFLVTGGIHGNEWAPPAAVLSFITRLLTAYHANTEIRNNAFTVTAQQVRDIVDRIDLYVAPICNPDGYDLSRSTIPSNDLIGRKNGLPSGAACTGSGFSGVNINRNFDVVWAFDVKYAPLSVGSSRDECDPNFIGPSVFSEPEARNVRAILDEGIEYYVDCHMFGPTIMHSWGIETNQNNEPLKRFTNPDFDGIRDGTAGSAYAEHIITADERLVSDVGQAMKAAIVQSTSTSYAVNMGAIPVSLTGAADDYAYSRHLDGTTPQKPKVLAYTLECGDDVIRFRPDFTTQFPKIEQEVHAALLRYLVWILENRTLPPPSPPPAGPSGTQGKPCCIFSVLVGTQLAPAIEFLRAIRDVSLRETARGARFADWLQRVYYTIGPPVAGLLARHARARRAAAALLFRPWLALMRPACRAAAGLRTPALRVGALTAAIVAPPLVLTATVIAAVLLV